MSDLADWVWERLGDSDLDDDAAFLVAAALQGDEELDDYLANGAADALVPAATEAKAESRNAVFLRSITVEGFRGIGPATTIELPAGPGLTVIAGRNGSGKSSLAEAFELVLTGHTYRWQSKKSVEWKDHWRNLHHGEHASISVQVVEEHGGPITLRTAWAKAAEDVDDRTTKSQRKGKTQVDGLASLGWDRQLERFRPILSYDELGGLLEGPPSQLYDAIADALGVAQLTDALKRIQQRHSDAKRPGAAATQERKALQREAAAMDDERAAEAAKVLRKTDPDTGVMRALATGTSTVDSGPLPLLRALASLATPTNASAVGEVAGRLRKAVEDLADAGAEVSHRELARLELLESALQVHDHHGDMTCPVCRQGDLDTNWASRNRESVEAQRRQFRGLQAAKQTFDLALDSARGLIEKRPAALNRSPVPELDPVVDRARAAWDAWAAAPDGSDAADANGLSDHLIERIADLEKALAELRSEASDAVTALDDRWQPLAARIATWCADWEEWRRIEPSVAMLATAETWLKANDLQLKNERLAPISNGAREVWLKLRQESNVELGTLTLKGSAKGIRRLHIESAVDGAPAGGMAVLSQGELHALALALFLPRATRPESPFRFLVLDDPVQAMDPAKVDGLVELLSEFAQTHQVIVLSHDDRLAAAVRRSPGGGTILEVTRGKDSHVSVTTSDDPTTRYLSDAFALVKDDELPDAALRRTLPGLLRMATEAAARDRYFAEQLTTGVPLAQLEEAWHAAPKTRGRVGLALGLLEHHQIDGWATKAPYRRFALKSVGVALHSGLRPDLDPLQVCRDVERMINDVRVGAS